MSSSGAATFRVRGDVLDIFPAEHAENAVRVSACSTTRSRSLQLFDAADRPHQAEAAALHGVPVVAIT